MLNLQDQLNRVFGSFFGGTTQAAWLPSVDVFDTKDAVVLKADIPGVEPSDVSVEINENVLTIRGERKQDEQPEEDRFYRMERPTGTFERSIALPQGVLTDDVQATFSEGVLTVRVPKAEEVKPRRIPIEVRGAEKAISGESKAA
jgi:HSP20 family protein